MRWLVGMPSRRGVDPAAVRNTQDVDILLRRSDLEMAAEAMLRAGFVRRHVAGVEMFLDGPDAKPRDAVRVVMAGEKIRPDYPEEAPDVTVAERPSGFAVLSLEALVRMKLTSFRLKDQVHLQDMLEVGLIDESWVTRLGSELGTRLRNLIDIEE